jgi:hypothetical protein
MATSAIQLESCPICRSGLGADWPSGGSRACPNCNSDLTPYFELQQRSGELLALASELLLRGDAALAREVADKLSLLSSDPGPGLAELRVRLAIAERDFSGARELLSQGSGELREHFEPLLSLSAMAQREAQELYNTALSCARRGAYRQASQLLAAAAQNDPDNGAVWQLRLKTDLKAGDWQACLSDLFALDRLGARPAQFKGIEALLPRW